MEIKLTEDAKYWLKVYAVLDKVVLKWEDGKELTLEEKCSALEEGSFDIEIDGEKVRYFHDGCDNDSVYLKELANKKLIEYESEYEYETEEDGIYFEAEGIRFTDVTSITDEGKKYIQWYCANFKEKIVLLLTEENIVTEIAVDLLSAFSPVVGIFVRGGLKIIREKYKK